LAGDPLLSDVLVLFWILSRNETIGENVAILANILKYQIATSQSWRFSTSDSIPV
jgi:hypothetical protein